MNGIKNIKKNIKIIGLAGTLASGKDTIGHFLADQYGYFHVSTSDMIRLEKKRVYGDSPEALLVRGDPFANHLRQTRGPGILVDLVNEEYQRVKSEYPGGFVASGVRSIGEVESIHNLGGLVVFVDADTKTRYERSILRSRDSLDKQLSFDEFVASEGRELPENSNDKTIQNLPAVRKLADIYVENNGYTIEAFDKHIESILGLGSA